MKKLFAVVAVVMLVGCGAEPEGGEDNVRIDPRTGFPIEILEHTLSEEEEAVTLPVYGLTDWTGSGANLRMTRVQSFDAAAEDNNTVQEVGYTHSAMVAGGDAMPFRWVDWSADVPEPPLLGEFRPRVGDGTMYAIQASGWKQYVEVDPETGVEREVEKLCQGSIYDPVVMGQGITPVDSGFISGWAFTIDAPPEGALNATVFITLMELDAPLKGGHVEYSHCQVKVEVLWN